MKTKSKCTTYERAIQEVDGFSSVFTVMREQTAIGGRTDSTFYNYIHRIALGEFALQASAPRCYQCRTDNLSH